MMRDIFHSERRVMAIFILLKLLGSFKTEKKIG